MDPRYINCMPFCPSSVSYDLVDCDHTKEELLFTKDHFSKQEWNTKRKGKPRPGILIWDLFGQNISEFNYEREIDYPLFHRHDFLPDPNPCDPVNICTLFPNTSSFSLLELNSNAPQANPTQDKTSHDKHVETSQTNADDDDDDDDDVSSDCDGEGGNHEDLKEQHSLAETQKRYDERFPYSEKSRHEQSVTFTFEHTLYTMCLKREKQQKTMKTNPDNNQGRFASNRRLHSRHSNLDEHKRNYSGDMCLLDPRDRNVLLQTLLQHLTPEQIKLGILEWFPHFPFPFHRNPKLNHFQLLNLQERQQQREDEEDEDENENKNETNGFKKHKTPTILWNKCSDALRELPSDHFYALPKQLHFSILYLLQRPPFCFRFRLYDLACWFTRHLDEFRTHPRLVSNIISFENAVSVSLKACNLGVLNLLVHFDPEWFGALSDDHWIRRKMMTDAGYIAKSFQTLNWNSTIPSSIFTRLQQFDIRYRIEKLEQQKQQIEEELIFLRSYQAKTKSNK